MSKLRLIRPHERTTATAQTPGMQREAAIDPALAGSKGLWAGYVVTGPGSRSAPHHHGDAESGIYVLRGRIRMSFGDRLEDSFVAEPGDFIYVPPQVVHVEENLSETEPAEVIVFRNATEMLVVNLPSPESPRS